MASEIKVSGLGRCVLPIHCCFFEQIVKNYVCSTSRILLDIQSHIVHINRIVHEHIHSYVYHMEHCRSV